MISISDNIIKKYEIGDFIEFKYFTDDTDVLKLRGKILSIYEESLKIKTADNEFLVSYAMVITHYPKSSIDRLTIRVLLKDLWKNFIFREVKTVKTKDPYMVTYQYLNKDGFVRTQKFITSAEAQKVVPYEYNKNIQVHYRDYFGFTNDRTIRNNDIHYNQEIFFSKKCYGELNLYGETITGEFSHRRGFKTVPPRTKQYICGLVETGEKGLFYRKWFICSKEFLTLWTMICEPDHYSLKNRSDGKYITKSLDEILEEVDGNHYSYELRKKSDKYEDYRIYNIENAILYETDIYQKIILSIFNPTVLKDELYDYGEKIKNDLAWMK